MSQPIIILTRPQLVENIGAVARAMMNCALTQLRVVAPRDGWPALPNQTGWQAPAMPDWIAERLFAASSGADAVLHRAQAYPDLPAAIADLHHVYATTAREHAMVKPWSTPRAGSLSIFLAMFSCHVAYCPGSLLRRFAACKSSRHWFTVRK